VAVTYKDSYKTLGVPKTADAKAIKQRREHQRDGAQRADGEPALCGLPPTPALTIVAP
jgi:hypothetical protein